jgi:hypothetical protein
MRKLLLVSFLFLNTVLSSQTLAGIINIEYSIDFTEYSNNASWFVTPPTDYHDANTIDDYLSPTDFFVTVQYNTNRLGEFSDTTTGSLFRNVGLWAEILDTNIDLSLSKGPNTYNMLIAATRNRGTDKYISTVLANVLDMDFDFDTIEEATVGAQSFSTVLEVYLAGEYEHVGIGELANAFNRYRGVATITNITQVPEPTSLVLFGLGIAGLLTRRYQ